MVAVVVHASESQHWYKRDGSPCYEVMSAKPGVMRPATLRDARKLGLVPSVTEIIKCCYKYGLERWKLEQMLHAALTLPRLAEEPEDAWISRVWADSQETAKKAAERGTAIHKAIQEYYETLEGPEDFSLQVLGAQEAVSKWCRGYWTPERSFAFGQMGFGGKVDLSCAYAVLDFKTKEFNEDTKLDTWDEQAMQLAAYRTGLGFPQARCAIVYVSVTVPGLAKLIEIPEKELERGWRMFCGLLTYWKAKNNYDPSLSWAVEELSL